MKKVNLILFHGSDYTMLSAKKWLTKQKLKLKKIEKKGQVIKVTINDAASLKKAGFQKFVAETGSDPNVAIIFAYNK